MPYEIIGEYSDDDFDSLEGDVAIGAVSSQDRRALARARQLDPKAVLVRQRPTNKRRRKVLPATQLSLTTGASGTVTFETQEKFRPERFVVAPANAADFTIQSIVVATTNQFAAPGDCPAAVFAPDGVDVNVEFDTADVGAKIVIAVTNISGATSIFRCAFIGTSVD